MGKYETKEEIRWRYLYRGEIYDVLIKKKKGMHNYRARYNMNSDLITVSCPSTSSEFDINATLAKMMPSLLRQRDKKRSIASPTDGDELYLLGQKVKIDGFSSWSEQKKQAYYKKTLLPLLKERVRIHEKKMGIKPPYKVSVKCMKTRYGSNSSATRTLHFSTILISYSVELIDSVVIHELVHDTYRNHGTNFHKKLGKYDPLCKEHRHKLIKGIYE